MDHVTLNFGVMKGLGLVRSSMRGWFYYRSTSDASHCFEFVFPDSVPTQ